MVMKELILEELEKSPRTLKSFWSSKYKWSLQELKNCFSELCAENKIRKVYRVLDGDAKLGEDYQNLEDIPKELDTLWGEKKDFKDLETVTYYERVSN